MKNSYKLAGVGLGSFILGVVCAFLLPAHTHNVPTYWLALSDQNNGIFYKPNAIRADIPLSWGKLAGKVKFLERDNGLHLGYVVKLPLKSLPVSGLPPKYRKLKPVENGLRVVPGDELAYTGSFEFILKDSDGFTLMSVSSGQETLSAGRDNSVQGATNDTIPRSAAKRTKSVLAHFVVESCYPCESD